MAIWAAVEVRTPEGTFTVRSRDSGCGCLMPLLAVAAIALLIVGYGFRSYVDVDEQNIARLVHEKVNAERQGRGLAPLVWNSRGCRRRAGA